MEDSRHLSGKNAGRWQLLPYIWPQRNHLATSPERLGPGNSLSPTQPEGLSLVEHAVLWLLFVTLVTNILLGPTGLHQK